MEALAEVIERGDPALGLADRALELLNRALDVAGLHVKRAEVEPVHQIIGILFDEMFGVAHEQCAEFEVELGNLGLDAFGRAVIGGAWGSNSFLTPSSAVGIENPTSMVFISLRISMSRSTSGDRV